MTKKHFIAIAETIRTQLEDARLESAGGPSSGHRNCHASYCVAIITTAENLCNVFANENPRFDRVRFLAACGINR